MRVALVHDWLTGMRGGEKCLEALCQVLPEAEVFTLLHRRGSASGPIESRPIATSSLQHLPGVTRGGYRYLLPLMPWAVQELRLPERLDVVLSFSHAVAKGVTVPEGVPHVCYCFTPMRYAWHLQDQYLDADQEGASGVFQQVIRGPLREAKRQVLQWMRQWDQAASSGVTRFVACSRTVARRIRSYYGRSSTVVYPPVDTRFYCPDDSPREDYYLWVSALVPYKRVDLVLDAVRHLGRPLVVIGDGPQRELVQRAAGRWVTYLGWQPDVVIRRHYRRCRALLFPALEDFGIVPVEAQSCGAPVIAFGRGGACETVLEAGPDQRGTGWFFARQEVDALAEAIRRFEQQQEWFCPRLARHNALRFSVERFQREMLHVLHETIQEAKQPAQDAAAA